ncbi:MAG TPA: FG-GAP-like repeat-containing protein [Blastocatellia bacterium]|jgi:tetratricopeptide (TPR) repeat protein|nr:FG-GAP-like repeat-containing protein [Blastocatellia bacterium]
MPSTCRHLSIASILVIALGFSACRRGDDLPGKGSEEYRKAVSAFYVGLAAMQTGEDNRAEESLKKVTSLAPGEPAAWADLGLLALRQKELEQAAERLEKARGLAPDSGDVEILLGLLESNRGNLAAAIDHLRRAVELNPRALKARYSLAQEIERRGGDDSEAEAQRLYEEVVGLEPDNLAVQLEVTRLAAKRGEADALRNIVARLEARSSAWPPEVREQLAALKTAASGPNPRMAASRVAFLRNVLVRVPDYRQSLAEVRFPPEVVGEPITRFMRLPSPEPEPSAPDEALAFNPERAVANDSGKWQWAGAVSLSGEGDPVIVRASGSEVLVADARLPFPGGPGNAPPGSFGIAPLDFNYDFRTDLALAGEGGFRLFEQAVDGKFNDVTARMSLPPGSTGAAYAGAWAADIDSEGDLDILLAPKTGPPVVLRNNGDGSFAEQRPFEKAANIRGFAWADIDGDGDPDAALLDAGGTLRVYANERAGQFRPRVLPGGFESVAGLSAADVNNDALVDLIVARQGEILRLSAKGGDEGWEVTRLASWAGRDITDDITTAPEAGFLFLADLDNNGGLDLAMAARTGAMIWLSDREGKFSPAARVEGRVFGVADVTGDGRLDLVGVSNAEQATRFVGSGSKDYHWQVVRPRAAESSGDQRINSFGVGGEIEIRSDLLFQKQTISGPLVHFGLGERTGADLARIIWPNGSVQAEYDLKSDQAILTEQRLKGSCPWLFAYDGEQMSFVTDFIWRSPLGLRINGQDTANVMMTEDRVKIRGSQLAPRDGFYDLRITADLWETHFFDHVHLMVVDHPAGTEVFVDERFAIPPPKLDLIPTTPPRPFARARDDSGRDVTEVVRARDQIYLDTFGRGAYQGVARDHYVEVELGDDVPLEGAWLVGNGWIQPTDSSINVAISQGSHGPPQSLSLEVPDGKGGWAAARPGLGFPAGKTKTVMISLDGVFRKSAGRRLRLRTDMEVYWDSLEWASGLPLDTMRAERIDASSAELRYRGFNVSRRANRSSPELPEYRLAGTQQVWRDLIGYYTRFGEVNELLARVDDRYVIMNAGDELALRFPSRPPPPDGWVRDYVLVGDGWEKDGDYNTTFSRTVLPLPSHDAPDYTTPPGRLEDDPVYRRYPQDWQEYHTRYVTPERFHNALRSRMR